jgi:hypothetical protein
MLDTMYLRTISCLQNTLIYIIIVCKQTSALHITCFFKLIYLIKIYNLYFLFLYIIIKVKIPYKRTKKHSKKFVKLKIFLILILILPAARW